MKQLWETAGWKLLAAVGSIAFALSSWALAGVSDLKANAAKFDEHSANQIRREDEESKRLERIEAKLDRIVDRLGEIR